MKCNFMPTRDFLVDEYVNKRKTMYEIAAENNVSPSAVLYWMRKFDIPSRNGADAIVHPHEYTEEERLSCSKRFKGRIPSPETRKKISESRKKIKGRGFSKARSDGYITVYFPSHPNATREGYVMLHRLVMEEHLGRLLSADEVIHHINGDKKNNRICNLMLTTKSEHMRLHALQRWRNKR